MIPALAVLWLAASAVAGAPAVPTADAHRPPGEASPAAAPEAKAPAKTSPNTSAEQAGEGRPGAAKDGAKDAGAKEPGAPTDPMPVPASVFAPEFSLEGLNGDPVDSLYTARPVTIVHFWASWCVPCMREVPHLNGLAARYEPVGLGLYAVSTDDASLNELRQLARSYGMRYTILKADTDVVSGFGGFESFPTTFLVDQKGRIVAKHIGAGDEVQLKIEAEVRTLLAAAGRRLPDPSR